MSTETAALIVLIALALAMPAVFFREHNRNVKKMKEIGDGLEKILDPKDKVYTLLGTSLGFRALYKIDRGIYKRAEAVLILLPRHSLIYYPISKITSKHDKIIFKMEYAQNLDLSPSTIERKRKFAAIRRRMCCWVERSSLDVERTLASSRRWRVIEKTGKPPEAELRK